MHTNKTKRGIGFICGTILFFALPSAAHAANNFALDSAFPLLSVQKNDHELKTGDVVDFSTYVDSVYKLEMERDVQEAKAAQAAAHKKALTPTPNPTPETAYTQPVIDAAVGTLPIPATSNIGISSYYSRFHPGIDIRAKVGTPVYTVKSGTVADAGYENGGYGRYLVIAHDDGAVSLYAHMKAAYVRTGDRVESHQAVGEVGMTGKTTGPHLHFEIHRDGKAIDPIKYLSGTAENIIAKK